MESIKEEIKQNGKVLLSSEDGFTIPMIFKNLSGKNFSGSKYKDYLATVSQEFGVASGRIERYRDGVMVKTANIPKF